MNDSQFKLRKEALLNACTSEVMPGPLNGVIVLGFCYYLAGPIALQRLVEAGALVIKVENRTHGGDPTRQVFTRKMFNAISYGQLGFGIDYGSAIDLAMLHILLQMVDVVIDNRSTTAKTRDIHLQRAFDRSNRSDPLVYCSISGYPNPKKYKSAGLDASIQAATGMAYTNCASPEKPMKVGYPVLDLVTGLLAANQIFSSLYYLKGRKNSDNVFLSVSLTGASVWLQVGQVLKALEGQEYFRSGNEDQFAAPFSYYTAKDGLVSIATVNEAQFQKFCSDVLQDMNFHQKYPTIKQRVTNQAEFERDLNRKLNVRDRVYWVEKCEVLGIPASPVLTVSEAVTQPFVKEELLRSSVDGNPIVAAGLENSLFPSTKPPSPAPELDQHKDKLVSILLDRSMSASHNGIRTKDALECYLSGFIRSRL